MKTRTKTYLSEQRFSGRNMTLIAVTFALLSSIYIYNSFADNPNLTGDINNDNKVDVIDLSSLLSAYGTNNTNADLNDDGVVNILDLSVLLTNYNRTYIPPTPPTPMPGSLYVSATGNDSGSCTQSSPCKTLNRAYEVAQCGNIVNVTAGNYGAQIISNNKDCASNPVVFKAMSSGALFAGILFRVSGVTIDGVSMPDAEFQTEDGTNWSNISVINSSSYGFDFRGTKNLRLEGNKFDGEYTKNQNWMYNNSNFVIKNNTITRYDDQREADNHSEGIFVATGNSNGLIEGNQFIENGRTGHLFFSWWGGSESDWPHDICVQSNSFVKSHNSYYHIQFRQEIPESVAKIYISPNNTFDNSAGPGPWSLQNCQS